MTYFLLIRYKEALNKARKLLHEKRLTRPRPSLDDKVSSLSFFLSFLSLSSSLSLSLPLSLSLSLSLSLLSFSLSNPLSRCPNNISIPQLYISKTLILDWNTEYIYTNPKHTNAQPNTQIHTHTHKLIHTNTHSHTHI